MDNCIFQIEAALEFDIDAADLGEPSQKPNIVKKYVNYRIRTSAILTLT